MPRYIIPMNCLDRVSSKVLYTPTISWLHSFISDLDMYMCLHVSRSYVPDQSSCLDKGYEFVLECCNVDMPPDMDHELLRRHFINLLDCGDREVERMTGWLAVDLVTKGNIIDNIIMETGNERTKVLA